MSKIDKQINYWAHMLDESIVSEEIPVISNIGEFLDICKEKGEEVKKAKAKKQGKVVNATLADEDKKIKSREGTETAHKGDLVVDDGDDTFYAVNSKDISKYYELDKDGKSVTGDQTKWKKIAKELEYYVTPFDVDVKVQWQEKPLHATKGYALVCNDKDGKDISPVAPDVFNDKTLWLKESKNMKKPTIESFTYNPTENIFENEDIEDYYEGDFPAWALDYVVNGEIGSVSRSEKQMIDGWFAIMQEQGYDTTMISYGEDEYFSSRPEFGLACDCVSVKVYKAQSR